MEVSQGKSWVQKRIPRGLCEVTHVPNHEKLVMARMLVCGLSHRTTVEY